MGGGYSSSPVYVCDARHGGEVGRGRRGGGVPGGSGRCLREHGARAIVRGGADHAVQLARIKIGAGDTGVQLLEIVDGQSANAGKALAGITLGSTCGEGALNSAAGKRTG